MQSVCDLIPEIVPDDLESIVYHCLYYQCITGNLHLLKADSEQEAFTSHWHHSLKLCSPVFIAPSFSPKCIFCKQTETKGRERKTELPVCFPSYKKQQMPDRCLNNELWKWVLFDFIDRWRTWISLLIYKAKHYPSCFKSFQNAYFNYGLCRAGEAKYTEYAKMTAAHEKVLILVQDHIQTHVIQQNEIKRLTS